MIPHGTEYPHGAQDNRSTVLMITLHDTERPPLYSRYPPTVLMISPHGTEHPQGTEHPRVLNIQYTGCEFG